MMKMLETFSKNVKTSLQFLCWLVGWGLTALLTQNRSYRAFINFLCLKIAISSTTCTM